MTIPTGALRFVFAIIILCCGGRHLRSGFRRHRRAWPARRWYSSRPFDHSSKRKSSIIQNNRRDVPKRRFRSPARHHHAAPCTPAGSRRHAVRQVLISFADPFHAKSGGKCRTESESPEPAPPVRRYINREAQVTLAEADPQMIRWWKPQSRIASATGGAESTHVGGGALPFDRRRPRYHRQGRAGTFGIPHRNWHTDGVFTYNKNKHFAPRLLEMANVGGNHVRAFSFRISTQPTHAKNGQRRQNDRRIAAGISGIYPSVAI